MLGVFRQPIELAEKIRSAPCRVALNSGPPSDNSMFLALLRFSRYCTTVYTDRGATLRMCVVSHKVHIPNTEISKNEAHVGYVVLPTTAGTPSVTVILR